MRVKRTVKKPMSFDLKNSSPIPIRAIRKNAKAKMLPKLILSTRLRPTAL